MDDYLDERAIGTDRVVEEVGARFGLGVPEGWADLGGSRSTNLRLSYPDASVVARIHRGSTKRARLSAIQAARIAVADAGIPAPVPLASPDGDTVVSLSDGRLVEVEPYVPAGARMNTPTLLQLGVGVLARLHRALSTATLPDEARSAPYANALPFVETQRACHAGAQRVRSWGELWLTDFADRAEAHLEQVVAAERPLRKQLPTQIVHGDFWNDNVQFEGDFEGAAVTAVFDFDFMAERLRIDDLALVVYFQLLRFWSIHGHGLPGEGARACVGRLIAAYDDAAEVPLSSDERAALPLAVARQPAWSLGCWIRELDEPHARDHAEAAAEELPVAEAVLAELSQWQQALGVAPR